jgi:hypothetical protein
MAEGLSDDNPIALHGIKSIDFSKLLWIFYNPLVFHSSPVFLISCHKYHRTYAEYSASVAEWVSILTLADMWGFDGIRSLCIGKLGDMALDPVEKMELCRKFEIHRTWASGAYETLCARSTPLSFSDATRIGMEDVVLIAQAREKRLKNRIYKIRPDSETHRDGARCSACGRTLGLFQNKSVQLENKCDRCGAKRRNYAGL